MILKITKITKIKITRKISFQNNIKDNSLFNLYLPHIKSAVVIIILCYKLIVQIVKIIVKAPQKDREW